MCVYMYILFLYSCRSIRVNNNKTRISYHVVSQYKWLMSFSEVANAFYLSFFSSSLRPYETLSRDFSSRARSM